MPPPPRPAPTASATPTSTAGGAPGAPSAAPTGRATGQVELTALLAMSMALAALGIDLMLPAFGAIRADLGLAPDSTAVAGLVTAYFLGLALGQLVYGPLADRFGRRPTLFLGFAIYGVAAGVATFAPSLPLLLAARFVWGLGAAGSRVVTLAVVRDRYEGERMSRAMSFIMAVFIVVPVVAPTVGAAIAATGGWRWIFASCLAAVAVMAVWARRLPETLREEHRRDLAFGRVAAAARVVVSDRRTVGYTLAMTALYGVFTSYIGSSELIFRDVYDQVERFPLFFGGLAAVIGLAMLLNARIVGTVGTRRLGNRVLAVYLAAATALVVVTLVTGGTPPLWAFLALAGLLLACHGLLIPNFNTIAMTPMAAVAGTASSVIGAVQLAVGALLGALLDQAFDGTIRPLAFGFLGYGVLAAALVAWAERSPDPAAAGPGGRSARRGHQ